MPRLTIVLLCIGLLASIAGATYALRFNPEMDFWKEAAKRKLAWVDEMRSKHGHVIGVVGGSTTTFGIDAETIEREHGLPVANLGLHAGMGPDVCAGFGFTALERGDTLIVSIEPSMLCDDESEPSGLGVRMAWALGRPALVNWREPVAGWRYLLNPSKLQPGGYHAMTMLGKLALKQPPYRYNIGDSRPGGLQVTSERRPHALTLEANGEGNLRLSDAGRHLLSQMGEEAASKGIRIAYLLPWAFVEESEANKARTRNKELLEEIGAYLPIIQEAELGLWSEHGDFADSRQHLTEVAARKRSNKLALLLREFLLTDKTSNTH